MGTRLQNSKEGIKTLSSSHAEVDLNFKFGQKHRSLSLYEFVTLFFFFEEWEVDLTDAAKCFKALRIRRPSSNHS